MQNNEKILNRLSDWVKGTSVRVWVKGDEGNGTHTNSEFCVFFLRRATDLTGMQIWLPVSWGLLSSTQKHEGSPFVLAQGPSDRVQHYMRSQAAQLCETAGAEAGRPVRG